MDQMNLIEIGRNLGMMFVPFLFALCFHEFAHGLVAKWFGDNTAERMGRLSLNPVVHADPIGTWVLPIAAIVFHTGFMFGWAKPVPVDSRNLKRPLKDMFWIALAGPASNILLAIVSTVILGVLIANGKDSSTAKALTLMLVSFIQVNVFLALFNMIPVHPLDGGKVIAPFLPIRWNMWLEQHQAQLSMMLMFVVLFAGWILAIPAFWVFKVLEFTAFAIAGHLV